MSIQELLHSYRRRASIGLASAALLLGGGYIATHSADLFNGWTEQSYAHSMQTLPEFDAAQGTKLLTGNWQTMPGVTQTASNVLEVSHSGEAVLQFADNDHPSADNSSYGPNPPVNLFGTHLEMTNKGNIGLSARLTNLSGSATVSFLSLPPVRYDESVVRQPGVDVTVKGNKATISVWDTPGAQPRTKTVKLSRAATVSDVTIAQTDNKLHFDIDGKKLTLDGQIFQKQVWFGLDTSGSYQLDGLSAYPVNGNKLTAVDMSTSTFSNATRDPNGLYATAAASGHANKLFGTAVDPTVLMSDPAYTTFIIENFNEIETEMLAKFQALQPEQGRFQFAELDALVNFASKHNLTVHGHALIFGEAYPQWLQDKLTTSTKEQATQLLQNHIQTVISRYDGKHGHGEIKYWDVVNEPLSSDDPTQLATYNLWYKAIGPDYITQAFQAARRANPSGVYSINENGMEVDQARADAMFKLVQSVNQDEKLIDQVGYQAHFDEDTLKDKTAMAYFMAGGMDRQFLAYKNIGVGVRISEATVANNDDSTMKARVYGRLMQSCTAATNCSGLNLWGATNNSGIYFYNTASITDQDPGDDAPTTQQGTSKIILSSSWTALLAAAANKPY